MQSAGRRLARPLATVLSGLLAAGTLAVVGAAPAGAAVSTSMLGLTLAANPTTLAAGGQVTYTVTVTNNDPSVTATGISVTDTFPTDLTYSATQNLGTGWSCTPAAGSVACALDGTTVPLAPAAPGPAGSSTLTLAFDISGGTTATSIADTASIDGVDTTANPGATATVNTPVTASNPDLSISQKWVTYPTSFELDVKNLGTVFATGTLTINVPMPAGVTFVSVTGGDWTAPAGPYTPGQAITLTSPNLTGLAPNATSAATVTVAGTGRFSGYPSLSAAGTDPNPTNNTAFALQSADPALGDGSANDPGNCGPSTANVRLCTLVATDGTLSVPVPAPVNTVNVPVWSFALDNRTTPTADGTAKLPGVTLLAIEGETLQLDVRNSLPTSGADKNALRIEIPGLPLTDNQVNNGNLYTAGTSAPASTRGAAPAWTTYKWDNLPAGTYMYEAGPTDQSQDVAARQVSMGAKGVLIVRPKDFGSNHDVYDQPTGPDAPPAGANACTVAGKSSTFTNEALVELDELNIEFHTNPWDPKISLVPGGSTDPNAPGGGLDRTKYVPDVFVVNGQPFDGPNFDPAKLPTVIPADCLLLDYANLGQQEKTVGMVGRRQTLIANDDQWSTSVPDKTTNPVPNTASQYLEQDLATKYINPGEVANVVVSMAGSAPDTVYPIVDYGRHFTNGDDGNSSASLGGMIAGVHVLPGPKPLAPIAGPPTISSAGLVLADTTATPATPIAPVVGDLPNATWTETNGAHNQGLALADTIVVHHGGSIPDGGVMMVDALPPVSGTCPAPDANHPCYDGLIAKPSNPDELAGKIMPADLAKLANGDHTLWIRAHDSVGWSDPPVGVVFTVDNSPALPPAGSASVGNLSVDPVATNGSTPAQVAGGVGGGAPDTHQCANCAINGDQGLTVDGVLTPSLPDWAITGFRWTVLTTGANGTVAFPAGTFADGAQVEITAADMSPFVIPTSVITTLGPPGKYTLQITPTEQQGSTSFTRDGTPQTVDFTYAVGTTGETTTISCCTPNPAGPQSDHTANLNYFPAVRVTGTFEVNQTMLPGLNVANGEMAFVSNNNGSAVDPLPATNGGHIQVTPETGMWNSPSVGYQVDIPSAEFNAIQQGVIKVFVHFQDSAGNWTKWESTGLTLDKTPPRLDSAAPAPSVDQPTTGHYTLEFTPQDPGGPPPCASGSLPVGCGGLAETSHVVAVEWTISHTGEGVTDAQNDFVDLLPTPTSDTPGLQTLDISGGPQNGGGYPIGAQVEFRFRDGAGNWTDWITVDIPGGVAA